MKPAKEKINKAKNMLSRIFSRFGRSSRNAPGPSAKGRPSSSSAGPQRLDRKLPSSGFSNGKMKVEVSKFETSEGVSTHRHKRKEITLPPFYSEDKIVAMVRDPWWIYAYWEVTPQNEAAVRSRIAAENAQYEASVLRVYDITGIKAFNGTNANSFYDIRLKDMAQNWYIDVNHPNRSWCIEVGILSRDGRFYCLARSNYVHTPRFGMSDVLDEEWMSSEEDYWLLFGISGGFGVGKSSMEIKEIFHKYFKEWVSSGAVSSFSSFVLSER